MTVWIMYMPLDEAGENDLLAKDTLPLPFGDLPDLSHVASGHALRKVIVAMDSDITPELLGRMQEQIWKILSELQPEDIVAVPLSHACVVRIAEVTGKYVYDESGGMYRHQIAVKWHKKALPFAKFRLHKQLIDKGAAWTMAEVEQQSVRTIIHANLPRSYNRFAKVKWIASVFILWQALQMLLRMKS